MEPKVRDTASNQAGPDPTTAGAGTRLKWLLFRLLEWASELRSGRNGPIGADDAHAGAAPRTATDARLPPHAPPLWVYASTIGELNAIEPFLRRLLDSMGGPPLVLLTDHPHYRDSFLAKYPHATVRAVDHRSETANALIAERAPRLLVLAEIPGLLSDAPCRFSFGLVYGLKRRGVPVCMINGWLYRGSPSCTMDAIEKALFGREYPRLFDLITVQDHATRDTLVAAGADPQRVFVTGNIKFDAAVQSSWTPAQSRSPALLESIAAGGRPTIVAGCVTNIKEQTLALDAFTAVLRQIPDALLVLAPRHPEVKERMVILRGLLAERGLSHGLRTETGDAPVPARLNCLVLDTMGELKDFYAAATIAYVGLNHNVLEPMAYGKPVVVTPGWERAYPSFPVYQRLLAQNAIMQVEEGALGEAWLRLLRNSVAYENRRQEIGGILESLKGATARNVELLARFGPLRRREQPPIVPIEAGLTPGSGLMGSARPAATLAVVVPFYQLKPGILPAVIRSALGQRNVADFPIIVVDDASPVPPRRELAELSAQWPGRITIIEQRNAGPGAARNNGLDHVPEGTRYVAFLDSDDRWEANHLQRALAALEQGYDFYFADFYFSDYKEESAFDRARKIAPPQHRSLPGPEGLHEYQGSMFNQVYTGNVIGTSTVVYRYEKFPRLRFREEFFNGQDYAFWLDLNRLTDKVAFSSAVECDYGMALNIYSGAGWGTEHSLSRIQNEIKLWRSTERFYDLTPDQLRHNAGRVAHLRRALVMDLLHRLRHRKPVPPGFFFEHLKVDPTFPLTFLPIVTGIVSSKLRPHADGAP